MTLRRFLIAVVFVLLVHPTPADCQGGGALRRIVQAGELRIGTSGTQPPFTAQDKTGTLMGYEIELARYLADAMGVRPVFVEIPFPELLPALTRGEVDIVMSGMTITPDRNLQAVFIGPYIVSGKSILAKASRAGDLDEVDKWNRSAITVVVLRNSTSQGFAERIMPRAKHVTVMDYPAAVAMVLEDKADLMIADFPVCALSLLRHPEADLVVAEDLLTIEPIGLAIPADSFQLHNLIENQLTALQMAGILEELEAKWFGSGEWLARLP